MNTFYYTTDEYGNIILQFTNTKQVNSKKIVFDNENKPVLPEKPLISEYFLDGIARILHE